MAGVGSSDLQRTLEDIVRELAQEQNRTSESLDSLLRSIGQTVVDGKKPDDWSISSAKAKAEYVQAIKFAVCLVQDYRLGRRTVAEPTSPTTQ